MVWSIDWGLDDIQFGRQPLVSFAQSLQFLFYGRGVSWKPQWLSPAYQQFPGKYATDHHLESISLVPILGRCIAPLPFEALVYFDLGRCCSELDLIHWWFGFDRPAPGLPR